MELLNQVEFFILSTAHAIYESWGWVGVALLLVFENATGITPSELILGLAGWMLIAEAQASTMMIFLGAFYAALGSVMGASIPYWIARLGGRPLINRLARWLRIDLSYITQVESQFQRWGAALVLGGRVIPGMRTVISIPAGLARMPFISFTLATFIGAYAWCALLIGAGYWLGHEWGLISAYLKAALPYLLALGALALGLYVWIVRRKPAAAYALAKNEKR